MGKIKPGMQAESLPLLQDKAFHQDHIIIAVQQNI